MNLLLYTFLIPITASVNVVFSQNNERDLWKQESFGYFNMDSEVLSKRGEYSKHFKNGNGKITAVITAGPIHYFEENNWKTIYHSITQKGNGFENTTNSHKTYYPFTSNGHITTILEDGNTMKDMIGMRMYYQSKGKELTSKSIQSQKGEVNFNELIYKDVYGKGIDLKLEQNTTNRKMDYIIRSKSALGSIPDHADFLVFEEKVELPSGWKASVNGKTIELKNVNGKIVAFYDKPLIYDSPVHTHDEFGNHVHADPKELIGDYKIHQNGNVLTIKTLVPVSWLKQDLAYPLFIDPTITLYPDNAARWTGHHRTNGGTNCHTSTCAAYTSTNIDESVQDNFWLGRFDGTRVYHGWIKFNITDIPDDACINSAVLQYYVNNNSSASSGCVVQSRFRHMATDPSINDFSVGANNQTRLADIRDGDIYGDYNTAVLVSGTGWYSVNLNANMQHLQSQLVPNWFAAGLQTYNGANNHLTCRNQVLGYSSSNRPRLIVNYDEPYETENITICQGELPYTWYGQSIPAGGNGVATHMTTGTNGCDLEITLNLTVNPGTPPQTDNQTICSNELPGIWNGQTINAGGNAVATHTSQDANGCNYVTTLNLTVIPVGNSTETITICSNELPYTWNGQTVNTGGNGVAIHTINNGNGCNDTISLNLVVSPGTNTTEDISICQDQLPYTWNGQTINAGGNGVATHTTGNGNGCNIITTLNLTVFPIQNTTENISICQNELPYIWNGQTINAGGNGVATHTYQNANGCDVTATLNLTVNPVTNNTENISICQDALPYIWNGQSITTGGVGIATHVSQDANGCDVTTSLNLTIAPVIHLTDNISICSNALPYTWNGQTINSGGNGIATHTTQDANGCEVVTTLNLDVTPVPSVDFSVQYEPCLPSQVTITPSSVITGINYSWQLNGSVVSTSSSGVNMNINTAGCYDVVLEVSTPDGCTSSYSQTPAFCVDTPPIADFSFSGDINISIDGNIQMENQSSNATSYTWIVSNGTITTQTSPVISFENDNVGTYNVTLYAYSENGCVDSITKPINVKEDVIFFIPNSFTPDHDEYNNSFGIVIASGIDLHDFSLLIFNRWGEMIWESHDASVHWDGTYNGKMVQDGTYTWKLEFKEKRTDKRHMHTGHVSIIR